MADVIRCFKLKLASGVTFRVRLEENVDVTLARLEERVAKLPGVPSPMTLAFRDDDDDLCEIFNDSALTEALELAADADRDVLTLEVRPRQSRPSTPTAAASSSSGESKQDAKDDDEDACASSSDLEAIRIAEQIACLQSNLAADLPHRAALLELASIGFDCTRGADSAAYHCLLAFDGSVAQAVNALLRSTTA